MRDVLQLLDADIGGMVVRDVDDRFEQLLVGLVLEGTAVGQPLLEGIAIGLVAEGIDGPAGQV